MTEKHQSEYSKNWLLCLIDQWNIHIENIVAIVSDNAANIKKLLLKLLAQAFVMVRVYIKLSSGKNY